MLDAIMVILGCGGAGVLVLAIAIGLLWIRDRLESGKKLPTEIQDAAHSKRLWQPDWRIVEERLGRIPERLRELYRSFQVQCKNLTWPHDELFVAEFSALDEQSLASPWPGLEHGCLPFAGDGCGNQFFLRADTGPQWPVYFHDHETGEIIDVAPSLDAFLSGLRVEQVEVE